MKFLAIGVLFAVTLVSISGCHWRHRRWRDHDHRHRYSYLQSGDMYAPQAQLISRARDV